MASREKKTDYASKAYKHREHRSRSGRRVDYRKKRERKRRQREGLVDFEYKMRKFKKDFIT